MDGDQMELQVDDYVYLNGSYNGNNTAGNNSNAVATVGNTYEPYSTAAAAGSNNVASQWSRAISVRTGCHGLVPPAHTERTAESNAWTLHETVQLAAPAPPAERPDVVYIRELIRKSTLCDLGQLNDAETLTAIAKHQQIKSVSETDPTEPLTASSLATPQQFYVLRHGERVDFTFGPDWHREAFIRGDGIDAGTYRARDLNMPPALPVRQAAPSSWVQDGPLTEIGRQQAWLTGRALREAGVSICHVYCSPAFRCVQTAAALLDGLGVAEVCAIRVEPALFEWLIWYEGDALPQWMTVAELRAAGYNADDAYVPTMTVEEVHKRRAEDCGTFYARNWSVAERAVRENGECVNEIAF